MFLEDTLLKTFRLFPYHLDFLESINENHSEALRIVLDRAIELENKKIKFAETKIQLMLFGVLFLLVSMIADNLWVTLIGFSCGALLILFVSFKSIWNLVSAIKKEVIKNRISTQNG